MESSAPILPGPDGKYWSLWRGDSELFDEFDIGMTRAKVGFFFAEDRQQAEWYASPYLGRYHLRAKNPINLMDDSLETFQWMAEFGKEYDEWIDRYSGESEDAAFFIQAGMLYNYEATGSGRRWNRLFDYARGQGHDAVIVLDATDGVTAAVVVVFDPSQIELQERFEI